MASEEELFRIFPVFLVIDISYSMEGEPIDAVNAALPSIKQEMIENPMVGQIARVSVITFAETARAILPLCDLAYADMPRVTIQGGTNFAAAFRTARQTIETSMGELPKGTPIYRPVLFFMSDGEHISKEDWRPMLASLRDTSWKFAPEIVTFGFGKADKDTLRKIATRFAFLAKDGDPAHQVREIMNAIIGSIRTTSTSFHDPDQEGGLHIEADSTTFTRLPAIEI